MAATLKNDYLMLGAIKDNDLIAAEFKKHKNIESVTENILGFYLYFDVETFSKEKLLAYKGTFFI